ncbi:efflux RND transporter permease subunit [Petrimonas sp.]|uniref:efflux RND transporter permease subunit n=1 Tax=Petrimonas sp. TaxID=2023866 RepID=UPI003F510A11
MKIYESAVRNPISTALIFIGIMLIGVLFYTQLPLDMFPEIEMNQVTVITSYPGAGSDDVETNVTRPLEDVLNSTENLKKITSQSKDNISLITLEFNYGTKIESSVNDVRDKLEMAKSFLPDDATDPIIFKFSTDMIPVTIMSAMAEESSEGLYKILDDKVANPLNRIPGVGTVSVMGAPKRQIQINLNPEKLEAYRISAEQIAQKITQENVNVPAGSFDIGSQTYMLRLEGEFDNSSRFRDIIVGNVQGQAIYLRDVATVNDTIESRVQESYTNGKKAATIIIQKQSGANSVDISKRVQAELPKLQQELPPDVQLALVMDTAESITTSIDSLTETIMFALIIVSIVVMFFLGRWRAALIILVTIPISLIGSFIYLYLSGNTLNIISLSALSISIGLVVDDAIVVLENITTHLERGSRPKQAAIYGTEEVSLSVIASTLTIIAVFLPMTMVGGFAGIMFKQLGWMVTIIISLSTISALTLTPMMTSKMLRAQREVGVKSRFDKAYNKYILPMLDKLDDAYSRLVNYVARKRWRTVFIVTGLVIVLAVVAGLGLKTEFMPSSDNNYITMTVELPTGTRMEVARETGMKISHLIAEKYPEINIASFSVGQASEDNTWASMSANGSNIISFNIGTNKAKERDKSIFDIADELRTDLAQMPELYRFTVSPGGGRGMMGGGGSNVQVDILGYDLATTDRIANELRAKMADIKGLRDVVVSRENYRQEYKIEFDREKLSLNGLSVAAAATAVRNRINGVTVSQFREEGEEYSVVVRYGEEFRQSIEDIENISIATPFGGSVKVRELGTVVEASSLPQIDRQNRERIVSVTGTLYRRALSDVVADVNQAISTTDIPGEIGIHIGGSYEDQQDSFGDLLVLLFLVVVLTYIVIASQFESLTYPFIIILTVPIAFVGSLLALVITGQPLGIMGFVGVIMLVGIIVKNGIVLIDYINLNRERGMSIVTAVVHGGKSRLRPVLMTSLTTILGMIPMAVGTGQGSSMWQTLGITVIGGMTFATVLTLVLIPALYTIFGGFGVNRRRKKHAIALEEQE